MELVTEGDRAGIERSHQAGMLACQHAHVNTPRPQAFKEMLRCSK
jgi:hypothetical protein